MFLTEQESLFNVLRDKRTTTIALKTNHACKGSMSIYYGSLTWFFNSLTFGDICVFGFKRTISFIFFHVISVVKTTCPRIPKRRSFFPVYICYWKDQLHYLNPLGFDLCIQYNITLELLWLCRMGFLGLLRCTHTSNKRCIAEYF